MYCLSLQTLKEVLPPDLGAGRSKSPVSLPREADDLDENDKNQAKSIQGRRMGTHEIEREWKKLVQ